MKKLLLALMISSPLIGENTSNTVVASEVSPEVVTAAVEPINYPELATLEKRIATVGEEKLKLILGADWIQFNHYIDRARMLLESQEKADALLQIEKSEKLLVKALDASRLQRTASGILKMGEVELDPKTETITIPGSYKYSSEMPVEVALCAPNGRAYEGALATTVRPFHLATLLEAMGVVPVEFEPEKVVGVESLINFSLSYTDANGTKHTLPVEALMTDEKDGSQMKQKGWIFIKSIFSQGFFCADNHGDIAQLLNVSPPLLIVNDPEVSKGQKHYNAKKVPGLAPDAPVTIIISKFKK